MRRFHTIIILLIVCSIALAMGLLLVGTVDIPAADVLGIVCGKPSDNEPWNFIILESRLPLIATAADRKSVV